MFNHCQPIFINNLYGILTINTTTTTSSTCLQSRQWYFFYDYGYTLLIRLINTAQLISNAFVLKIFSTSNDEKTLVFDSSDTILSENDLQFDMKTDKSGVWLELISTRKENLPQTSFMIDYAFRANAQSRYGRQILQQNSSFDSSQPAFIGLICVIAVLVVAILIAISILCYRYCSHRKHSKTRRVPLDQAHLAESNTPSSSSSYSVRSTQQFFPHRSNEPTQQTSSSLGQSLNTVPSIVPSRRLQQSMMDAYLNDFHSLQPTTLDPKQLHPYLFIDLHSTSSETVPDGHAKKYGNENSTTSGYDTSTGGEDRTRPTSLRYRRRRRSYHQQRQQQRRRSTLAFKRTHHGRFLMRERSLPHTLVKLPQLRQRANQPFHFPVDQSSSSSTSNQNQDFLSLTTDNFDENHAYHLSQSRLMDTIEEERPAATTTTTVPQGGFFEMVSVHRGDDSDMPQYDELPLPDQVSRYRGTGVAYINESIIV